MGMALRRCFIISLCKRDVFTEIEALFSEYGNVRKTRVGISDKMMRRSALAKLTFILSIVNVNIPPSSTRDTSRGIYLDDANLDCVGVDNNFAFMVDSLIWIKLGWWVCGFVWIGLDGLLYIFIHYISNQFFAVVCCVVCVFVKTTSYKNINNIS